MNDQAKISNKHPKAKRILCAFLCFVMVFAAAVQTAPSAYAADFSIDTSNFKTNEKSAETVYYWHEGLPPTDVIDGTKYPVLITWDDKYYLSADGKFVKAVNDRKDTRIADYDTSQSRSTGVERLASKIGKRRIWDSDLYKKLNDKLISGSDYKEYAYSSISTLLFDTIDSDNILIKSAKEFYKWFGTGATLKDFIFENYNDVYSNNTVDSYARPIARYNMSSSALLAANPVYAEYQNLTQSIGSMPEDLKKNGFAATISAADLDLPCLVCVEASPVDMVPGSPGLTQLLNSNQSRWAIWIPANGDTLTQENNWLVGTQHYDVECVQVLDYTTAQGTNKRADILYDFSLDIMSGSDTDPGYSPKEFIKKETRIPARTFKDSAVNALDICLEKRSWVFEAVGDKYDIYTYCGLNMYIEKSFVRDETSPYSFLTEGLYPLTNLNRNSENEKKLFGYAGFAAFDFAYSGERMSLLHDGSTLVSYGADDYFRDHQDDSKVGFRIFWAEPITMNYYRTNFSVVSGQVTNIDGPACIDTDAVYRVKDGGVLVMTDWVIINGAILVEKGGTLVITDNTDAYGHTRYATLMSQVTGTRGGRIACEGTIIIMPNCKCFGGGTYGIQLGDGACVVNYGVIGSENFTCYHDYTIENRGEESVVFAGYGITGSGFALTNIKIAGESFLGRGTRESTCSVRMARNSVYGPGTGSRRFYVHPDQPGFANNCEPRDGTVVDLINYKTIEWTFTADALYDFTFPNYWDGAGGGMLKYVWIFKGMKVDKLVNGKIVLHNRDYVGGIMTDFDVVMSDDDYVEIVRGGRHDQWEGYYVLGKTIYFGSFGNWTPPAGTYVLYED